MGDARSPTPAAAWVAVHRRGWMDLSTIAGTQRDARRKLVDGYVFGVYGVLQPAPRWARLRREGWTVQRVAVIGLADYYGLKTLRGHGQGANRGANPVSRD